MSKPVIFVRSLAWASLYLATAVSPLLLLALPGDRPPKRSVAIEVGVGFGLVGYAMLGLQFLTTSRFRRIAPYFGSDAEVAFHRAAGIAAVTLVLAHPVILLLANPNYAVYFDPRANLPRAAALTTVTIALVLLIALSLWRARFRLSYEWWRLSHAALAVVVIGIGMVHALQVSHYVSGWWKQAAWVVGAVIPIGLLAHVRLVRPGRARTRPWRIVDVRADTHDTFHLILEPQDHAGMPFRAGQYAWLTLGETPWTLQQHPFSFLSSAERSDRVEFGIKAMGDFTEKVAEVPPGTTAFLEGPYGSFAIDPHADGVLFVVGGIGITPVLSILETCRDRGEQRPLMLVYANERASDVAFVSRLESLRSGLDLRVIDVLRVPPEDWSGETGLVSEELLDRCLDRLAVGDPQIMTCGPAPLMDIAERAALRRGVPQHRIASERFDWI